MTNSNVRSIMNRAQYMTRNARKEDPAADHRATLAEALRICWAEADAPAAELWENMTDDERTTALWTMTLAEYRRRDARTTRDGKPLPNLFTWVQTATRGDDLRGIMHEAFIRMAYYMDRDDAADGTRNIGYFLRAAVHTAAQYIGRQERRNARALRVTEDEDGNRREYIIDNAAPTAEPIAPGPESAAIIRDLIDRAAADKLDRQIIGYTGAGFTTRETAAAVGISQPAVVKRLAKIRERYTANA